MNKLRSWLIRKLGGTEKSLPVLSFMERPVLTPQSAEIKTLSARTYVDLKSTADRDTELDRVKALLAEVLADGMLRNDLITIHSQTNSNTHQREYLAEIQIVVPNKK